MKFVHPFMLGLAALSLTPLYAQQATVVAAPLADAPRPVMVASQGDESASALAPEIFFPGSMPPGILRGGSVPASASSSSASGGGTSAAGGFAITPGARRRAPRPPQLSVFDWSLLGVFATLRVLDYRTTEKCQSDPANFHETELAQALVDNKPGLAAFEASTVVANYYAYLIFVRHHHRTLAHLGQTINIGTIAWTVGWNYYYLDKYYPHTPSY